MKAICCCFVSLVAGVASAEARDAARFVVAERGAPPRTSIWRVNASSEVEKHAASELRDYVRRITGVELPVSLEGERPLGRVIQLSSGEFDDDGFELAEADLKMRGPGDFEGTRQSGLAIDLHIADLAKDSPVLTLARALGEEILAADPLLQDPRNALLARHLKEMRFEIKDYSRIS